MKKKLAELKIVSILLFVAIGLFVLLFIIQLCTLGNVDNHDESYDRYYEVNWDMKLVTGFNIIAVAFSYQINLFPMYNSLGWNKSNKTGLTAVVIGVSMTVFIYVVLGILCVYTFGSEL